MTLVIGSLALPEGALTMTTWPFLVVFVVALGLTLLLTPASIALGKRLGIVDLPGGGDAIGEPSFASVAWRSFLRLPSLPCCQWRWISPVKTRWSSPG
ncbi:MAG: hypothetical protein ABFD20_08070 [Anaerolineales bacterium]